jgi:outer membrane lipoprotein
MPSVQKYALAFLLLLMTTGVITGCAPALSGRIRDQAKPAIQFSVLQKSVENYEGRVVIYGGHILDTANKPDGTVLTILQAPLDSKNEPVSPDLSKGRFLVMTDKFLDPEIYSKGRKITVGGKVAGSRSRKVGNRMYEYPVIEAQELHLWRKEDTHHAPYYPYYYYPWYHPWYYPWYGPWHGHPYRRPHRRW